MYEKTLKYYIMKRIILAITAVFLTFASYAQISVEGKTGSIVKLNMGQQSLDYVVMDNDTSYFMAVYTYAPYHSYINVSLGNYREAMTLLISLDKYDNVNSGESISFNNPSNNTAMLQRVMGSKQYYIHEDHNPAIGQLPKSYLKRYIEELRKFKYQKK